MLIRLKIKNIALIQDVALDLAQGLTVLTGETGAGKSMLTDAFELALGARAETALLRKGAEKAEVEATFALAGGEDISLDTRNLLEELEIEAEEGELTLRRTLSADGKSRAFANGVRITQNHLKTLGDALADLHGQHDHQMLMRPAAHAGLLAAFGRLSAETAAVSATHAAWKEADEALAAARARLQARAQEHALLQAHVSELEDLSPKEGEYAALAAERTRLAAGTRLLEAYQAAEAAISGASAGDAGAGMGDFASASGGGASEDIPTRLARAERALGALADVAAADDGVGDTLNPLISRISALSVEAADVAREIAAAAASVDLDAARLDAVEGRLQHFRDIARKHGATPEDLPATHAQLIETLASLDHLEETMDGLEADASKARTAFEAACATLTSARQKAAETLAKSVEEALAALHMPACRFQVGLEALAPENWGAHGAERVRFLVATNSGADLQPLEKVASGGEISRLMLALKQVFYAPMPPMTLVFDEVDTGVGGATGAAIGKVLQGLARKHQVLVITHLPQVAACGAAHLRIEKRAGEGADALPTTAVRGLSLAERREELARMLSGADVTAEARQAAERLLEMAAAQAPSAASAGRGEAAA